MGKRGGNVLSYTVMYCMLYIRPTYESYDDACIVIIVLILYTFYSKQCTAELYRQTIYQHISYINVMTIVGMTRTSPSKKRFADYIYNSSSNIARSAKIL